MTRQPTLDPIVASRPSTTSNSKPPEQKSQVTLRASSSRIDQRDHKAGHQNDLDDGDDDESTTFRQRLSARKNVLITELNEADYENKKKKIHEDEQQPDSSGEYDDNEDIIALHDFENWENLAPPKRKSKNKKNSKMMEKFILSNDDPLYDEKEYDTDLEGRFTY